MLHEADLCSAGLVGRRTQQGILTDVGAAARAWLVDRALLADREFAFAAHDGL